MVNNNNNRKIVSEVTNMSKTSRSRDAWEEIIENLILENEPPIQYIKDAIVVRKQGTTTRLTPAEFEQLVAKEKTLTPDQSDIQHCSLSIDFAKIKRDVNRITNKMIGEIEKELEIELKQKLAASTVKKKKTTTKSNSRRKID